MSPPLTGSSTRSRSCWRRRRLECMCRSIKTLRTLDIPAPEDEVRAAALQYVRKVSGYRKPSPANEHAFNHPVEEVAAASRRLLDAVAAPYPAPRPALQ